MQLGSVYTITLGKYSDQYLCISIGMVYNLKRVRLPKSKIDGIRLPEYITITNFGTSVSKTKTSTCLQKTSTVKKKQEKYS